MTTVGFCTACGSPRWSEARFCRSCGAGFIGPAPLARPEVTGPQPITAPRRPVAMWVFLLIPGIVLGAAFLARGSGNPSQVGLELSLPASTIAVVELQDVGASAAQLLGRLRSDTSTSRDVAQLDLEAAAIGGLDWVVRQIGDVSLVVTMDGGAVNAGLVVVSTDPGASNQLLATFTEIAYRDAWRRGWTVALDDVGGVALTRISMPPADGPVPGLGEIEPSFAISGDLVVFGTRPTFVESVIFPSDAVGGATP